MHVLLIDDDSIVLMVTSAILEGMGHRVSTLSSALDASEFVTLEKPDVVVVDRQMPDLSGEEWLHIVGESDFAKEIRFILLSGAEVEVLERIVRETCAVGYIRKLAGPQDFAKAFEQILSSSEVER